MSVNSAVSFSTAESRAVSVLLQKYYSNLFNGLNTATGNDEAELNTYSGIIEYTNTIAGDAVDMFTLTNNKITGNDQKVNPEIWYNFDNDDGNPTVVSVHVDTPGTLKISVKNQSSSATNASFFFKFQIDN